MAQPTRKTTNAATAQINARDFAMPPTPETLSSYELCQLKGFWTLRWDRNRMDGTQMLQAAIRAGVTERERQDIGEVAGEAVMVLGEDRGLETTAHNLYDSLVHHAALADILTTAIRKPTEGAWLQPEPVSLPGDQRWLSGAFLSPDGTRLRRVCLVSHWSDDRHYSEARSWYSMGEVCAYGLPMQQVVLVLGQHRDGRRHSPWTKGLLHPSGNHQIRFRKKTDVASGFKDTWVKAWREEHGEIDRMDWLQAMLDDDVLRDVCFTVDIEVPEKAERQRILELAARKLDQLQKTREAPDRQLTGCDFPVPCIFRTECHAGKAPREGSFIPVDAL